MHTTDITHDWPPVKRRKDCKLGKDYRVITGAVILQPWMRSYALADVEADPLYRPFLWPPCTKDGYQRYSREFSWEPDGRVLHYRIVDTPIQKK